MKEQISMDYQVVVCIFTKYIKAKKILKINNFNEEDILKEASVNYGQATAINIDVQDYEKHIQIVNTVLALMPKNEYIYIVRTFLFNANKNWWKNYYHYQEYEKLQKNAINYFLYLYLV